MGDFGNTTITYNSFTFSNEGRWKDPPPYPVPFISKTVEYLAPEIMGNENRWCRKETLTLKGKINTCVGGSREEVIDAFTEDFHTLEVLGYEDFELVRVMSVDVGPQESTKTFIEYTITLESYPEDSFALTYRVINPSDVVEVAENDNGTATLTHTVSCRGLNTEAHGSSSNALANAEEFVKEKMESETCLRGTLIESEDPDWGSYLVSVTEDINRITAEYSMTNTYVADLTRQKGGEIVVKYTKTIDEGWGERTRVTHSGQIDGGRHGDLDDCREAYSDLRKTFKNPVVKSPFLISEDVQEDEKNKTITFSIVLQDDGASDVIDDYSITVSENSGSSLINVSIQGTVSSTGPMACRMKEVRKHFCGSLTCKGSAKGIDDRYSLFCQKYYKEYLDENQIDDLPADVEFEVDALAVSVTENIFAGTISYSMQFDNRITHGHHKANHTMSFKPSLQVVARKELNNPTSCNGQCEDNNEDVGGEDSFDLLWMGFRSRCEFGIAGQIISYDKDDGSTMDEIAENKYLHYCGNPDPDNDDSILIQAVNSLDRSSNSSYDYKWSFHTPSKSVNKFPATALINTFNIEA